MKMIRICGPLNGLILVLFCIHGNRIYFGFLIRIPSVDVITSSSRYKELILLNYSGPINHEINTLGDVRFEYSPYPNYDTP